MRTGRQRAPRRKAVRHLPLMPGLRETIEGRDVLIAGLFSAKQKEHLECMGALAAEVAVLGGRVAGCFVQRRGISGGKKGNAPGGKGNMSRPYSSRTLMSTGKIREIAQERISADAVAVVFFNPLTDRQRKVLAELLGCPVFSRTDLHPEDMLCDRSDVGIRTCCNRSFPGGR